MTVKSGLGSCLTSGKDQQPKGHHQPDDQRQQRSRHRSPLGADKEVADDDAVDRERNRSRHHRPGLQGGIALSALEREFAALYSPIGRPSIPPEKLLRAMLLQAFYSIRSERLLMERLEYELLCRWFVGIGVDDAALGPFGVLSKNRERLLEGDIAAKFLAAVLAQPKVKK